MDMGRPRHLDTVLWLAILSIAALSVHAATSNSKQTDTKESEAKGTARVSFNESIRPILVKNCVACHGGPKQAAGVTFLHRDGALSESDSGVPPIVSGKPDESYLVDRISDPDDDFRMPPADHGPRLTESEVNWIREWIKQGANWEEHWSLVAPQMPEVPEVKLKTWPRNDIDRFILARLEIEKLTPSPAADRMAWLRRVSFDLIGLPPTRDEMTSFAADNRPDAFERVVDRLLNSKHFGERWASVWLDLARYADTMGYEKDNHRDVWPYRDWLIRAFNADMPYDEFTIKQLAGDLLPDASLDDHIATVFHRNSQTNTEGGTDDEEFRIAAVLDRVNTTWQVWQGTTFGCTQCHAHPYDAFKHEDYYKFVGLLNSTRDSDVNEEYPKLAIPTDRTQYEQAEQLDRETRRLESELHHQAHQLLANTAQWKRLTFDKLSSSGSTELTVKIVEGKPELWAGGTITSGSKYKLETPLPREMERVTAIRIEAMPQDLQAALRIPEMGFTLSRLSVKHDPAGDVKPRMVKLRTAFSDEAHPMLDPEESLKDSKTGWSEYSKIFQPRSAVFVLDQPLEIKPGDRLGLELQHRMSATGDIPLVIRRARIDVSGSELWTRLVDDPAFQAMKQSLVAIKKERSAIESTSVVVMQERPETALRKTYMFVRGNWLDRGEQVEPGLPSSMPDLPEGTKADRLGLAKWLVSGENPLSSRVMVNRVWGQLFGAGLVRTAEDFGGAGELPSHPKLLDYLALRYQDEFAWSLKKLLKEITLSATYRQDSSSDSDLNERDPLNRLLARGPRPRLSAEMVRDQALRLSGRMSDKMFGEPVMPYQPEGIWRSVYSGAEWKVSEGEDRYRRAVYTYWKRTSPYPSMMSFDMPSREICTVRRQPTNTPLQALVTMNDPAYIDLASGFAERIELKGGNTAAERVRWAYQTATGQSASGVRAAELESLYQDALRHYAQQTEAANQLAATPERFALTVVANAIMNLDEVLVK